MPEIRQDRTNIGQGFSGGMSVGVAPSFSLSNSYRRQEAPYILLTHIMRTQQKLLDVASEEGAYYTDVYALARTKQGAQSLVGLIPEAFHGPEDVVTGVQERNLSQEEHPTLLFIPICRAILCWAPVAMEKASVSRKLTY